MKTTSIALILLSLALSPLLADRTDNIMFEFRAVEEAIKNRRISPEIRKQTLERNLLRAVDQIVARRFYGDRDSMKKELTIANVAYENPTSPTTYYVRFKNLYFRLDYIRSPEEYEQSPIYVKYLVKEAGDEVHPASDAKTDTKTQGNPGSGTK